MFESFDKLVLGLLTGIVFGVLLQKGRVAKFDVIVGQLLLRDHTVVKIMATAVIVGSIGVHALVAGGLATLHVKPALLGGLVLGGVLFGLGMAILGYCPGHRGGGGRRRSSRCLCRRGRHAVRRPGLRARLPLDRADARRDRRLGRDHAA